MDATLIEPVGAEGPGGTPPEDLTFTRPGWMADAACRHADPDLFFPTTETDDAVEAAARVCQRCDVREACLDWAVDNGEVGVWGGASTVQRRALRTARPRRRKAADAPYGWGHEDGELVPVPDEQAALEFMRQLRAQDPPWGFRDIAAALDRAGVKPRGGGRWWPRSIASYVQRDDGVEPGGLDRSLAARGPTEPCDDGALSPAGAVSAS